jgi:hypothetical protein
VEDREHTWQLSATDTAKLREFLQRPNGSWLSADWNVQVDACGGGVLVRTQRYRYHSPLCVRCVYCGNVGETQGEAATHEPINDRGNFACKGAEACGLRQQGADAAYVLAKLLRDVQRELAGVHPAMLASLAADVEDFAGQARAQLGEAAEERIAAERRDRAERQGRLF